MSAGCGPAVDPDESKTLQLAFYPGKNTAHGEAISLWVEEVEKASEGELSVEAHFNASLVDAETTADATSTGRVDVGYMAPAYTPSDFPLTMVGEMPFVTTNMLAQMDAFYGLYHDNDALRQEWAGQDLHVLAFLPVLNNTLAFQQPIQGLESLRGLNIRTIGRSSLLVDAVGANALEIPYPEVYGSLQRGIIDAVSGVAFESVYQDKFYEVAPHVVGPRTAGLGANALVIGTQLWDSLSSAEQDALTEASETMMNQMGKIQTQANEKTCQGILDAGGSVNVLADSDVKAWEKAADDVVLRDWASEARQRGVADPSAFYETYVSAVRAAEKENGPFPTGPESCAGSQ